MSSLSSSSSSLWTQNNINELSRWPLLWWMKRKRRRRQAARNTSISILQTIFSPSKTGLCYLLCFFLRTGMVDGRQFLNKGWMNAWFHFFTITPSGDKERTVLAVTGFETTTNPESQVWPHWICVGNAKLAGFMHTSKNSKGAWCQENALFCQKVHLPHSSRSGIAWATC